MSFAPCSPMDRKHQVIGCLLVLGAFVVGFAGAFPYAGSWNDGSRLAAVESVVDHHTLAIDDSIFVRVPADAAATGRAPYPVHNDDLLQFGTRDKLLIRGHFYSDKPAVISFLMAGWYWLGERCGLPPAVQRPDLFCRMMTVGTSGLAYAVAVWCIYGFGRRAGLPVPWRMVLSASFALATVALPYTRHVNNHMLLLGLTALLLAQLLQLADEIGVRRVPWLRLMMIGTLGGLAYNLDLGAGPVLLMCLFPLVVYRTRRAGLVLLVMMAAAPWLIAHHALNYAIGGTLKPMNTVPEYSQWLGCPFTPENMTGFWRHGPAQFVVYAIALLFGKHGFVGHNLPLFLLLPAMWHCRLQIGDCRLKEETGPQRGFKSAIINLKSAICNLQLPAELLFGVAWCCGTWLLYSAFSNNFGGACCSIRWFVPFLAPAYYGLALFLGRFPSYRIDFCILSGWGVMLGAIMWRSGPWILHMVPLFWPVQAAALLSWLGYRLARAEYRVPSTQYSVPSTQYTVPST